MVSFGSIQIFEKKKDCVDNYEADVMSLGIWTLIRVLIYNSVNNEVDVTRYIDVT